MATLKAEVKGGRLVMDEPTDLPEGTVLELVEADPFADLSDEQLARLHGSIERGLEQAHSGEGRPAQAVIEELRARR